MWKLEKVQYLKNIRYFSNWGTSALEIIEAANVHTAQDKCISTPSLHLSAREIEFLGFVGARVADGCV